MKKKLFIAFLVMTLVATLSLTGCGTQETSGSQKQESSIEDSEGPMPSIDDIQFEMKSGIIDGERVPVMNITNNTEYDFVYFDVEYVVKKSVKKKQLKRNEELREKAKSMDHSIMEITVGGGTEKCVRSGETIKNQWCNLDGTIESFKDVNAIKFFEPDILKVAYIVGDKIYGAYYDYQNKEMSMDDSEYDKCGWSDSNLAKMIPKPDADIVVVESDDEDNFNATIFDADKDMYKKYLKACKEKGFTKVDISSDDYYWAYHKKQKDIQLRLSWSENDNQISIYIDKE